MMAATPFDRASYSILLMPERNQRVNLCRAACGQVTRQQSHEQHQRGTVMKVIGSVGARRDRAYFSNRAGPIEQAVVRDVVTRLPTLASNPRANVVERSHQSSESARPETEASCLLCMDHAVTLTRNAARSTGRRLRPCVLATIPPTHP